MRKQLLNFLLVGSTQLYTNITLNRSRKIGVSVLSSAALFLSMALFYYDKHPHVYSVTLPHTHKFTYLSNDNPVFAQSLFTNKLEAFTKLLASTEGKSYHFYKDNIGIAVGYGWNPTQNAKEFNLKIAEAMNLNKKETLAIILVSNTKKVNYVPKELAKLTFSEKQVQAAAKVSMDFYEQEFLNVLKVKSRAYNENYEQLVKNYSRAPDNQKAVLIHMTYKVGAYNLLKYEDFFQTLFIYLKNPETENLIKTAQSFEYSFKNREGDIQRDTRVEQTHENFFLFCLKDKIKQIENQALCQEVIEQQRVIKRKIG